MNIKKLISILLIAHVIPCHANMIGQISNQYNIRDDILEYIHSIVPPLTANAKYAIIRIVQNQQQLYYKARSYVEASKIMESSSIARRCLSIERPKDDYEIFKKLNNLMMDTQERKEHALQTCAQFFSTEGFVHLRINKSELIQRCENKDY